MWPLTRNLKIPFLMLVSKRHTERPVYVTIHAQRLHLKKEQNKKKKKKREEGCYHNPGMLTKKRTSSPWAYVGFFSFIPTEFSLLKWNTQPLPLRRIWPTTLTQAFSNSSLVHLWRGPASWSSCNDPIHLPLYPQPWTGKIPKIPLHTKHTD